jgi:hypothetical protein
LEGSLAFLSPPPKAVTLVSILLIGPFDVDENQERERVTHDVHIHMCCAETSVPKAVPKKKTQDDETPMYKVRAQRKQFFSS